MTILEGSSFFPYNPEADQYFKKQLALNDIQILMNKKITKIDYLRRVISIEGQAKEED